MFDGIKGRTIKSHKDDYYQGAPCPYHRHSGQDNTAYSWRKSDTHACMECVEEAKAGHFSLDLHQLHQSAQNYARRFWKSVDISHVDNCWRWTGKVSKTNHLFFMWRRPEISSSYKHHPIRVLNWLSRGDIGMTGVKSLCGERRCCNPLHQIPDFLENSNVTREEFKKQRLLLIEQLHQAESPAYLLDTPTISHQPDFESTYFNMLKFYEKSPVRQFVK